VTKNRVIPQMFDVRPVDKTGNLDWEKIGEVEKAASMKEFVQEYNAEREYFEQSYDVSERDIPVRFEAYESGQEKRRIEEEIRKREELEMRIYALEEELERRSQAEISAQREQETLVWEQEQEVLAAEQAFLAEEEERLNEKIRSESEKRERKQQERYLKAQRKQEQLAEKLRRKNEKAAAKRSARLGRYGFWETLSSAGDGILYDNKKAAWTFAIVAVFVLTGIGGVSFAYKGLLVKGKVLGVSQEGYESLNSAISDISKQDFNGSSKNFIQAFESFSEASEEMDGMGALLTEGSRFFPYISKISSGKNILEAGKHLSIAGNAMNGVVESFSALKNPLTEGNETSFLELFRESEKSVRLAHGELELARGNIEKVKIDDLPEEMRDKFLLLRQQLPRAIELSDAFLKNSHIFSDLLGGNGPRKYLFLFQNNNEMRATGGFIGSYGLLDISNGRVKNFFIDGIFNPDGQLKEKIVPPKPIQKISAAWSLHDSNWFPDFPTSAKEAVVFYEKTGGPTADGVITFTPVVLQKLLEITGPIEMPEYDVVLDSGNFVEKTQYEVEEDFDKEENNPKKILSDLAPMVLDRIVNSKDLDTILRTAQVFVEGLGEKHILIYSQNAELQRAISQRGWSGEVLEAKKDYLSVINTNINGYKTDGVVEEKISQRTQIKEDGSVVNKVSITRKHNGGNTDYEWWNKVNANYMRVYVPKGSKLLSVEGQTREFNEPPLDYDGLGFKRNGLVEKEEDGMVVDEETGTRIYEESGKTVFANWTYVSPQETMTITYEYELPFKLFPMSFNSNERIDSYSLVVQKQSGSMGSGFEFELTHPWSYEVKWQFPQEASKEGNSLKLDTDLKNDKFMAVAFERI